MTYMESGIFEKFSEISRMILSCLGIWCTSWGCSNHFVLGSDLGEERQLGKWQGGKQEAGWGPMLLGACGTNTGPWENALAQKLQFLIWTRRKLMPHESLVSAFISCTSLGWRSHWVPERAKVARLYPGVKIVTLWEPDWCPQRWQYRIC